jgi:peptidoglycan/xylan/chitin deacetylase (PgdA/CDA1 family)
MILFLLFSGHIPATHAAQPSPLAPIYDAPPSAHPTLALTFDDGPSPFTPQILSVLHAFHVPATFFLVGIHVGPYASFARAEVAAGDELGNHTYNHLDLLWLPDFAVTAQLQETQAAIHSATGITPQWFRPPGGFFDTHTVSIAASLGLRTVLWSVDPRDWSRPGVDLVVARVLDQTRPGRIILMHDGGGDRSETVAALPIILRALLARGYRFVTLSALLGMPLVQPGAAHRLTFPRVASGSGHAPLVPKARSVTKSPGRTDVPAGFPTSCNVPRAERWFARQGAPPLPSHALSHAWLQLYCSGRNLGPATSRDYRLTPDTIAQDFARTAHRLEWNATTGTVQVTVMWDWAARIFSADSIQPQWHTSLTRAWFEQYLSGYDWGPALSVPEPGDGGMMQCFQHACAVARAGTIQWKPR